MRKDERGGGGGGGIWLGGHLFCGIDLESLI